jgi:hypothetical protein
VWFLLFPNFKNQKRGNNRRWNNYGIRDGVDIFVGSDFQENEQKNRLPAHRNAHPVGHLSYKRLFLHSEKIVATDIFAFTIFYLLYGYGLLFICRMKE